MRRKRETAIPASHQRFFQYDLAGSNERFAILGIQHLNKASGSAAYRVGGSIAFTGVPRAVWIFAKDPEEPDRRLFPCLKNNLGVDNSGFAYRIVQAENGSPRIAWGEVAADDVRTVLSQEKPNADREKISPEQDKVFEIIKSMHPAPVRAQFIAESLKKTSSNVSNLLNKLKDQGLVESACYGLWKLSPPSSDRMNDESSESSESPLEQPVVSSVSPLSLFTQGVETSEKSVSVSEVADDKRWPTRKKKPKGVLEATFAFANEEPTVKGLGMDYLF